jgi:hypothetical protein
MTPAQLSGKTSFSFPPNIEASFFDTRSGILHPLHVRGVYQAKGRPRRQKSRQGYGIGGLLPLMATPDGVADRPPPIVRTLVQLGKRRWLYTNRKPGG